MEIVNKVNNHFYLGSYIYISIYRQRLFLLKIARSYIWQHFPDHLAGFYTYLGSMPRLALVGGKVASVSWAAIQRLKTLLWKDYKNKIALWHENHQKTLFLQYQLNSKLFGTEFDNVITRVSSSKIWESSNGTALYMFQLVKIPFWW